MKPAPRRRSAGFTLLELLVVIVIIGLLTAIVGPRYFAQLGKSEQATAKAQIDALSKALDAYRLDTGRYPSNEQGLQALVVKPGDEPKWNGPYLQKKLPPIPGANRMCIGYQAREGTTISCPWARTASRAASRKTPTSRSGKGSRPWQYRQLRKE